MKTFIINALQDIRKNLENKPYGIPVFSSAAGVDKLSPLNVDVVDDYISLAEKDGDMTYVPIRDFSKEEKETFDKMMRFASEDCHITEKDVLGMVVIHNEYNKNPFTLSILHLKG